LRKRTVFLAAVIPAGFVFLAHTGGAAESRITSPGSPVIPAPAEIQYRTYITNTCSDSRRRGDDGEALPDSCIPSSDVMMRLGVISILPGRLWRGDDRQAFPDSRLFGFDGAASDTSGGAEIKTSPMLRWGSPVGITIVVGAVVYLLFTIRGR